MTKLTRVVTTVILGCATLAAKNPAGAPDPAAGPAAQDIAGKMPSAADQTILNDDRAIVQKALDGVATGQQFIDCIGRKPAALGSSSVADVLRPVKTPPEVSA